MLVSFIFLILSLFYPNRLHFLNIAWMNIGLFLGKIINPIVLGLIFYLLITQFAIVMRLFNRDYLKINLKKSAKTIWTNNHNDDIDNFNFTDQY